MTTYLTPPLTTDPETLAQAAFAFMEAAIPGWQAAPGNLDTLIIEAWAQSAAVTQDVASQALTSDFRYFGSLAHVPSIDAAQASASFEFTVPDDAGYTITGGSTVGLRDVDGDLQGFRLFDDLVVPPGSTTASATLFAEIEGTAANGLSGTAELVDVPGSVVSAVAAVASEGGLDAEDDDTYVDRLTDELTLVSPEPLLPDDFAKFIRNKAVGVYRACSVDLLKPGPPWTGTAEATNVDRAVTTAVTGTDGLATSAGRIDGQAKIDAAREQNFDSYVVDPNYATIDVTATGVAWPTFDPAAVRASAIAALQALLSPITWGSGMTRDPRDWQNEPTLRLDALYTALALTPGMRNVTGLTFGLHGGALSTTPVDMSGGSAVPVLPLAGTLSVTVT